MIDRFFSRLAMAVIHLYRLTLSPFIGQQCRFYPTCSAYALEAFERHGTARGAWLTLRRVSRCHPFHAGGVDPVPEPGSEAGLREEGSHAAG